MFRRCYFIYIRVLDKIKHILGRKKGVKTSNHTDLRINKIDDILASYIQHDKLHQAILIDAPWGTGKTWYLTHSFIPAFSEFEENKHWQFIYISLFGLSKLSELEKKINYQILNSVLNSYSQSRIKKAIPSKLYNLTDVVIHVLLKYAGGFDNLDYSKLVSFLPRTNYLVYIFDDIERTGIDIIELLGYINNLCEHNESRVIMVANEKQLLSKYEQPSEKSEENIHDSSDKHENNKTQLIQSAYYAAKEKAISLTVKFQMNPDDAFQVILNGIVEDKKIRDLILGQKDFIMNLFIQNSDKEVGELSDGNFINLRILSFIDAIINDLFQEVFKCLEEIQHDKKLNMYKLEIDPIRGDILQELLRYITIVCFNFKMGNPFKKENFSYLTKEKQIIYFCHQYNFVNDFVTYRLLDYQEMKQNLILAIKEYILSYKCKNSPLEQLHNWEYLGDKDIIQLLKQSKEENLSLLLEPGYIRKLIILLFQLKSVGFDVDINFYVYKILSDLKKMKTLPFVKDSLYLDPYNISNDELSKIYNKEMMPIYQWFDEKLSNRTKEEYRFLIKNEWNENFPSQCLAHKRSFIDNKKFLGYIDISSAVQKLKQSDPAEIYYFLIGIRKVYNFRNIDDYFKEDLPTIKYLLIGIAEIIGFLDETSNVRVKKANLRELHSYLKNVERNLV